MYDSNRLVEEAYSTYLSALLTGDRQTCRGIVTRLLETGTSLKALYVDLFQRSMYEIGALWEANRISVAVEHLASSITERLMVLTYPSLFRTERTTKTAIVSCVANEFHQLGGRMVADILEIGGVDSHFLGANTPVEALVDMMDRKSPDFVALSLSLTSNIGRLEYAIEHIRHTDPDIHILVGGQAFRDRDTSWPNSLPGVHVLKSLDALDEFVRGL